MLADDPAELFERLAGVVVRAGLPHDFARLLADDRDDVGFPGIPNDIVRWNRSSPASCICSGRGATWS